MWEFRPIEAPSASEQAARLLWRAGFGPTPGQAAALAKLGLHGAVQSLTRPTSKRARRARTRPTAKAALAPKDAWGHDHLWWLDRMVRTRGAAGRAHDARLARLVRDVQVRRPAAADAAPERAAAPARARQLRGARARHHARPGDAAVAQRHVQQPLGRQRELRARAAGAVLPRRRPRLHRARRAPARPRADRLPQRLDRLRARPASATTRSSTTPGAKRIYGKRGKFGWQEGVRLVTRHRRHPEFMVTKLWGYFIPTKPSPSTVKALVAACTSRAGREVRPLLEAILAHPRPLRRRAADGQAAGRAGRGDAARGRPRDRHGRVGVAVRRAPASTSSCRPTCPAGTTRAGWTPRRSAPAGRWRSTICEPARLDPTRTRRSVPDEPAELVAARDRASGARRRSRRRCAAALEKYAADTLATATEPWEKTVLPGAAR